MTIISLVTVFLLLGCSALFSGLTLGLLSLNIFDIKRKAELGHPEAELVYPIRKNGNQLLVTLLLGNVLVNTALTVVLNSVLTGIVTILLSTLLITVFGEILPQAYLKKHGLYFGAKLAPYVKFLLKYTSFITRPMGNFLDKMVGHELPHVYSKEELFKIMDEHEGTHTDIEDEDLSIARHALGFADKKITDVMIDIKNVMAVKDSEIVSPVLLNELHKAGFTRYPVYRGTRDNIIGVLYVRELAHAMHGKHKVRELMQKHLFYVNSKETLEHVMNAFLKTKRHLFIVIDKNRTVLGIITIEDIIDEALGSEFKDDFYDFDDPVAVSKVK